ncbi:MAG TPA: type I-U CRISPR-associated protein Csb2 [Polyangiaceae bacterium]|nr:type I-U CRISPR-associated protein Csb2 [Polyangiaceae bacterium]
MLTLEIELLTGVYRASQVDQSAAEWPPHPERVFSALVQAWGDGGQLPGERAALEWLEALEDPPSIEASEVNRERTAPVVYVPPNDARSTDISILPAQRKRQARHFRAVVPLAPLASSDGTLAHVRFRWSQPVPELHRRHLRALAHRVSSVGHSSSLVRLQFREEVIVNDPERMYVPHEAGPTALRVAYAGRLRHLEFWYSIEEGKLRKRPKVRATARYARETPRSDIPSTVFGPDPDWIVLEARRDAGSSFTPDVLAFPRVAKCIRNALMKFASDPPPEVISGHKKDGTPSESPHVAIVPLTNVGWSYSDGSLLGVGLILPRALERETRAVVLQAIQVWLKDRGSPTGSGASGEVRLGRNAVWQLKQVIEGERASLRPARYCAAACTWRSVTPVFLDRFLKGTSEMEEVELIAQACANIGLPERDLVEVQIHKHSAVRGAETTYPSRGRAHRPDWSFPEKSSYQNRPRRHVVLRFRNPVTGPVLLGAGRYHGMGLLLPDPSGAAAGGGVA